MSIEKNSTGNTDSHVTIKHLAQLNNTAIRSYITLNGCGFHLDKLSGNGLYCYLRCALPSDASGYLMGIKSSSGTSNDFYIHVANGTVTWAIGSDSWTHALESGVHDYGFANGKPIYDNDLVSSSASAHSGDHTYKMVIGGARLTNDTFSYISSMDLYRVNVTVKDGGFEYLESFYPISATAIYNSRKYPEESITITKPSGSTSSAGAALTSPYGVQLDDLRWLFGIGYVDVMAAIADDGGVEYSMGWTGVGDGAREADYQERLVQLSQNKDFAFHFRGAGGGKGIPMPSNASLASAPYSGRIGYETGELRVGRTPKWSIWNDCIKFGFYVDEDPNTHDYTLKFNFLKIIDVSDPGGGAPNKRTINGKVHLEWFDGYNTAENHPPQVIITSNRLDVDIHNGAFVRCRAANYMLGNDTESYFPDNKSIFILDESAGANIRYRAGNLIPWNYTANELAYYGYTFVGMRMVGRMLPSSPITLFEAENKESSTLCKDSTQLVKYNYRTNGITRTLTVAGRNKWHLLDEILNAPNNTLDIYVTLNIISGDNKNVDCSRFIPSQKFLLQGHFNEDTNPFTYGNHFRAVLETANADESNSLIGVLGQYLDLGSGTWRGDGLETKYIDTFHGNYNYSCIVLPLFRCTIGQDNKPVPIYETETHPYESGSTYKKYIGLIEVYRQIDASTYEYYVCVVPTIDGVQAFKNYCEFGSPTASSALSLWESQPELFKRFWDKSGFWHVKDDLRHVLWKNGQATRVPAAAPPDGDYDKMPLSTRFIVIPHRMLWNDSTRKFDNNYTVVTHLYPSTTNMIFSSFSGTSFSANTYQKYMVAQDFFPPTQQTYRTDLTFVSVQPYNAYPNSGAGVEAPMVFLFRAYAKAYQSGDYVLYDYFFEDISQLKVELYRKAIDYTQLANNNYDVDGTLVATFVFQYNQLTQTSGNYTAVLSDDGAVPDDVYFHGWAGEAQTAMCFKIKISGKDGAILTGGDFYTIKISKQS